MRDMVPHNDRSIRNIPLSPAHKRALAAREAEEEMMYEEEEQPRPKRRPKRGPRRWFWVLAISVVVVCAILGLLLSTLFAGASVTVYPKMETVTPPSSGIEAQLNAPVGGLPFITVTVTRYATTTVPASGTKQVSRSASGLITIYNASGVASQKLIANTRFQAPDGKIYRIHDSVTVPGGIKKADGTLTPGAIQTTVYADSAGTEYNRGETKLTIPGFKGDPKYDQFYAMAQSITNGFVGQEPAVAQADLSKAQATMQQALEQAARSAISTQVQDGFLPIPGTLQFSYGALTQTPSGSGSASISQSITAVGAIVRATSLASSLAKEAGVKNYKGEAVDFVDVSQVVLSATASKTPGAIQLLFSGNPTLVWQYDANALKTALLGKPKSEFQTIVQSFEPAITKAEAKVRPFWQGSFPSNPDKISISAGEPK